MKNYDRVELPEGTVVSLIKDGKEYNFSNIGIDNEIIHETAPFSFSTEPIELSFEIENGVELHRIIKHWWWLDILFPRRIK